MRTTNPSGQETVDEKRARYEAFEFAVCRDGEHVNVANVSYGEEERGAHIYSITVEDGEPVECSCPHHQHRGVRCKHIHAVASNEVVQKAIEAAQKEAMTDGGSLCPQGHPDCEGLDSDSERPVLCWDCWEVWAQ